MSKMFSKTDELAFVSSVNAFIHSLSNKDCIPLGPEYSLLPPDVAEQNLALYRLKKKFELPGTEVADLSHMAIKSMLEYDQTGPLDFQPATMTLSVSLRKNLYRLRQIVHEMCKGFKTNNTFRHSPGDTYARLRGDQSLFAKLKNRSNWTVTADCFDRAAGLIYRNRYLKKAARKHMEAYSRAENNLLWFSLEDRFEVFKCKLLDFVTIVEGSRASTVPKNRTARRVINIEPWLNVLVQLDISNSLLDCLSANDGYCKERAQDLHRAMIRDLRFATIDLSNASNSNWLAVIKWLFPVKVYNALNRSRCARTFYKDEWYDLRMISPMGNGFTFEVMTFALLCATRVFTRDASVYGDDIIIPRIHYNEYVELITALGYQLNESKTFADGNFRESCGAFYAKSGDSGRYLKSFDFKYSLDVFDAITNLNKAIALRGILVSTDELRAFIKSAVPAILQMQAPLSYEDIWNSRKENPIDSFGCVCIPFDLFNVRRHKRRDKEWTGRQFPVLAKHLKKQMSLYQYDHRTCDIVLMYARKSHTYITKNKWKKVPHDNINNVFIQGSFIYSGRCQAPTLRGETFLAHRFVVY